MSINNHNRKVRNRINLSNIVCKKTNDTKEILTVTETSISEQELAQDNSLEGKNEDINNIFNNDYSNEIKFNPWKMISLILIIIVVVTIAISINNRNTVIENKPEISVSNKKEEKKSDITITNVDNTDDKKETKEQYLFLGDSLFEQYNVKEFFKDYDVINSGVGGATAKDTLNKIESRVFEYNPTTIFLLIGTNDLLKGSSEQETFDTICQIIETIQDRLPEVKINVLSIFPINNTEDEKIMNDIFKNESNEKINETNKLIENYCKKNNITFIDMVKILKDDDENLRLSYTIEGLHITDLGYHFITNELLKYMSKSK